MPKRGFGNSIAESQTSGIISPSNPPGLRISDVIDMSDPFAHYRRNFVFILADYVAFGVGLTFSDVSTTLPAFVRELSSSDMLVGLVATVWNGAWLLPQLFAANWLVVKPGKKRYIILGGLLGRPLFLVLALALALGLARYPAAALTLFFFTLTIFLAGDALAAVAWFDVLAKAIPEERRGRLIGLAQVSIAGLALGVGEVVKHLLGPNGPPFPQNYALIFGATGGVLMLSLFFLTQIKEPDESPLGVRPTWRAYFAQLFLLLRQNAALSRVTLARLLVGLSQLALPFYVVYAVSVLELPVETIGTFTAVRTLGSVAAGLGMSLVADRFGSRRVIQIASALALVSPGLALLLQLSGGGESWLVGLYPLVYVAIGFFNSSVMLGFINYVLELAPPGQRTVYMGLTNTINGVLVLAPTLGAWLLGATSYTTLFGLTAAGIAVGHLLSWGLAPSRRVIVTGGGTEPAA